MTVIDTLTSKNNESFDAIVENLKGIETFDELMQLYGAFLKMLFIPFLIALIITLWIIHFSSRRKNGEVGKSPWGWIGANLILCIPVVSLIMLIIWSFGEKTKGDYTFRSWARLNLMTMLFLIVFIISTIVMIKVV